jgi:hypothetical protein
MKTVQLPTPIVLGLANQRTGSWILTTTDAMGGTTVDQKETFGRATRHTDLSGRLYTYAYNQDLGSYPDHRNEVINVVYRC